ncbi:kinase-like domain-containing protein [Penicillium chermesinum]|uniref:non-specific serine/threonine protein kinase n=1 Tax=Penicillium chermesinum TaxID=63820 RepID=A0A9W9P9Y5_9EURO|nr:kinase-like domain-containing protein [Penicillium chermesinum]KAJ5239142.1 kinase-like domain-containing protein [Penicillium chermesinum]KAJ6164783.1 kinase-like domain-containing protein [Penicillium chermesinum]
MESKASEKIDDPQHRIEYMPIEDVEKLERYRPGGYHPITIGEQLGGRYSIVHKLGFGSYSTVWLARNKESGKYVAIKIPVSTLDSTATRETDILRRLNGTRLEGKALPGAAFIPSILEGFSLSGPNGVHHCYVTEPGMMSLAEAKDASSIRLFQLPVARAMAAQLVQAVTFLHSLGIVHGGKLSSPGVPISLSSFSVPDLMRWITADLHDGNVLVRLPGSMDSLSPEQLYEKYGFPQYEPVVRLDQCRLPVGVPENVVVPIWLGKESELVSLPEAQIILTDFGESFMPATIARPYSNAPEVLTPPEVYFEQPKSLSFPADIWTLACTIWAIIAQRPLFEGYNPSSDWVIKEQVDCLGKLPGPWWLKWDARAKWFNENGERKIESHSRPLEQRFNDSVRQPRQEFRMEEVDEIEKVALLSMLKAMLAFNPEERPTAQEVLNCEWMQKWALPEFCQINGD